ncbi:MAG TPA: hypothetical protein PLT55_04615 [Acidimicrobiia bacterium]|nr:hypothetical protein [Acidimicrobiia bacterium]
MSDACGNSQARFICHQLSKKSTGDLVSDNSTPTVPEIQAENSVDQTKEIDPITESVEEETIAVNDLGMSFAEWLSINRYGMIRYIIK